MDDLVTFLRTRFDEDAETQRGLDQWHRRDCDSLPFEDTPTFPCNCGLPERILRDIDAKRQILELHTFEPREPETDAQLHARFAHPAYEYETTEGPRKQWDYADVPPYDDNGEPDHTWEPNTDAGDNGWARLDYTEEAYWRRRRPAGQERKPYVPEELKLLALPYNDHPDYRQEWRP